MEVFENDEPQGSRLTEEHKKRLRGIRKKLEALLPLFRMPVDPKIYPLIEVAIEMLHHQEEMELHFTYDEDLFDNAHMDDEQIDRAVKEVKESKKEKKPPAKKPSSKKKSTKPKKAPTEAALTTESPSVEELEGWFEMDGPDVE